MFNHNLLSRGPKIKQQISNNERPRPKLKRKPEKDPIQVQVQCHQANRILFLYLISELKKSNYVVASLQNSVP